MSGYSATKAAQVGFAESLRTEFAGTDIHVSVVLPVSTETEFRARDGARLRPLRRGARPETVARTPSPRAMLRCIRRPRAEVYPHAKSRALTVLNAVAPGFTDRPGPQVRPAARAMTADDARGWSRDDRRARPPRAGGRALIVGGWVRDRLLGLPSKDVDLEVFGLAAGCAPRRCSRGSGRSTPSARASRSTRLAASTSSLPRRESKTGRGHRGFDVDGDPDHVGRRGGAPPRLHHQRDRSSIR